MRKERISFDLDGVLYPWQTVAYEYYVLVTRKPVSYEEYFDKTVHELSTIGKDNLIALPLYDKMAARKDLVNMISRLGERFDIFYITSRPESTYTTTSKWLTEYNFYQSQNLIFAEDKTPIIRKLGILYHTEDRASIALSLINITNVILVKQHWNRYVRDQFKYVVGDVIEVEKITNG